MFNSRKLPSICIENRDRNFKHAKWSPVNNEPHTTAHPVSQAHTTHASTSSQATQLHVQNTYSEICDATFVNQAAESWDLEKITSFHVAHFADHDEYDFHMTGYPRDFISRFFECGYFYEIGVSSSLIRWQKQYGGNVLDVGLNVGSISIPVAKFCDGCNVFAIEGLARTFRYACLNNIRNGLQNLFMLNKALTDDPSLEEIYFEVDPQNQGGNKVGSKGISAKATTLDSIFDEFYDRVNGTMVFKMDIEGYELKALMGAQRWLSDAPPCVIIAENFAAKEHLSGGEDLENFLQKFGYRRIEDVEKHRVRDMNQIYSHESCEDPQGGSVRYIIAWETEKRWFHNPKASCVPVSFEK